MEPHIGRIAFNIVVLLVVLTLISLPFLRRDSPEFIVSILALMFSLVFLSLVVWDVRRQAKKEMLGNQGGTIKLESFKFGVNCRCSASISKNVVFLINN